MYFQSTSYIVRVRFINALIDFRFYCRLERIRLKPKVQKPFTSKQIIRDHCASPACTGCILPYKSCASRWRTFSLHDECSPLLTWPINRHFFFLRFISKRISTWRLHYDTRSLKLSVENMSVDANELYFRYWFANTDRGPWRFRRKITATCRIT